MSLSGLYAMVGSPAASSSKGAIYMFIRSGVTWSQDDKLTASDGASGDLFGSSLSLDGSYGVVGAYAHSSSTGSAYVFHNDDG